MSRKYNFILMIAVLVALSIPFNSLLAQEGNKNILFIFDASGSMKTSLQGKSKLSIAKEVMSDLVVDLPQDANVGLEVYGNKEGAQCNSIEVMVPLKKLDVGALRNAISSMIAKGKTPIAASLEKGAALLRNLPGEKALILVSDGEETCGGDPIVTAGKIRQEFGIDVVIHAVGFGVDEKTKQQLLGIAQAGGGSYYSADSADELKKSLAKIKEEVVVKEIVIKKEEPKPEPAKELYSEEFNNPALPVEWVVVNEDPEGKIIDKGMLTIVTAPGDPAKDTAKNLLLYKKEGLPENYEVIARYKTDVKGYYSNYSIWEAQLVGLILYLDKDNFMYLVSRARLAYDQGTRMFFVKYAKGEQAPEIYFDLACPNPGTFDVKIEKRGFKYTAYVGVQGEKGFGWKEIGNYTVLGKNFYPGIIAFRMEDAKEVAAEFDSFKINELK